MKTLDIVSLVTKGFTPSQIKEVAEEEKTNPDAVKLAMSSTSHDQYKELLGIVSEVKADPKPEDEAGDPGREPDPEKPDFETKYKEVHAELEKIKADLAAAQAANNKQNVAGEPEDIDKTMADIAANFM